MRPQGLCVLGWLLPLVPARQAAGDFATDGQLLNTLTAVSHTHQHKMDCDLRYLKLYLPIKSRDSPSISMAERTAAYTSSL